VAITSLPTKRSGLIGWLLNYASGLRSPILFLVILALFLINLIIPDPLPFVDELLLGLLTVLLGTARKRSRSSTPSA
jgi:hypothetical protein